MPKRLRNTTAAKATIAALLLLLGACTTRSISNAGYPGDPGSRNPFYVGELRETDVIGWSGREQIDDAAIARELTTRQRVVLRRQQPLLVIQSGALVENCQAHCPEFVMTFTWLTPPLAGTLMVRGLTL